VKNPVVCRSRAPAERCRWLRALPTQEPSEEGAEDVVRSLRYPRGIHRGRVLTDNDMGTVPIQFFSAILRWRDGRALYAPCGRPRCRPSRHAPTSPDGHATSSPRVSSGDHAAAQATAARTHLKRQNAPTTCGRRARRPHRAARALYFIT